MHYALDICLLIIFVFTVFLYTNRGFFKTLMGFGKTIISAVISFTFGKTVGAILADGFFNERITDFVYNGMLKVYGTDNSFFDLSQLIEILPESFVDLTELCGVNILEITTAYSNETAATAEKLREVACDIAYPISETISNMCAYFIVFVVSYLLLILVSFILNAITELPGIRFVNRILGFLLGCVCGVVYSGLFVIITKAVLLYIVVSVDENEIMEIINKTYIFKLF